MTAIEFLWHALHALLLLFGTAWLSQSFPWYQALAMSIAGVGLLIGLEVAVSSTCRR
jgi:hypothetical protein